MYNQFMMLLNHMIMTSSKFLLGSKVLRMSFKEQLSEGLVKGQSLSSEDAAKAKYGFKVIYINLTKTIIMVIVAALLGILKEVCILFSAYLVVRLFGFGSHSNSSIKCTIVGLIEFIGFTYLAIKIQPFTIPVCIALAVVCLTIFFIWAPVETAKRPISDKRKRIFKTETIVLSVILFVTAVLIGDNVYRNLIIMGVALEAFIMLPPVRKLIE